MKKFFSFICALAVVLSASAVPTKKLARNVKFMQKQELRQQKSFGAQLPDAKVLKGEKFAKPVAFRASNAQKEATDVKINSWEIEDWGTDGELLLYGDSISFYFDLIYGGDNEDLELGKTYTVNDIYVGEDGQYAGVFYGGKWNYGLKSLSIVKTIDAEGLVHFVGATVDSLDAAFTFHYDEEPFVPTGDTVKHVFLNKLSMTYSDYFGDWVIKANDSEYGFALDILSENAESPAGNYSSDNEDFDLPYTYVTVNVSNDSTAKYYAHSAKAIVAVNNDTTTVITDILAENGVVYSFAAFYYAPSKKGEDTIVATNLKIEDAYYDFFGIIFVEAENDDYAVSINLMPDTAYYIGDFTIGAKANGEITILSDSSTTTIYSGAFTIAPTNDGLGLIGKVLCENNIEYTLNLTYTKPAQTREDTITIDGLTLSLYTGAWQIAGYNADSTQFVSLAAYTDVVAGTYTEADLAADYSYIVTDIADSAYNYFEMVSANVTVTYNAADSTATVTGTFLGQNKDDVPLFTLNLTAKVPAPSPYLDYDEQDSDFNENFETYTVNDQYLAQYGDLIVTATNENGARVGLDIYIAEGASTLTPGVYSFAKTEEPMTVYIGSCDGSSVYYSFFGNTNAQGYINEMWFPVEGSLTIDEDGVITVDALNSYGRTINAIIGAKQQAIENTDAAVKATKRLVNGQLVIEKNGVQFNAIGTVVK